MDSDGQEKIGYDPKDDGFNACEKNVLENSKCVNATEKKWEVQNG